MKDLNSSTQPMSVIPGGPHSLYVETPDTVKRCALVEQLRDEQAARCAYGSRDGDGSTCDCKYASPLRPWASEATGCPELRAAIAVLTGTITNQPKAGGNRG